jgi:2,3,4,5-tetrahydropyridine-2-carboxylate N-succinyltransferase
MTKEIIEAGYNDLSNSLDISKNSDLVKIVENTIEDLNKGKIRVAEKINGEWVVNDWIKKAILLYFSFSKNSVIK